MRDKRVLVAKGKNSEKVIVKLSDSDGGKDEIRKEKMAQDTLTKAVFSQEKIFFPEEILFGEYERYVIRITKFIPQTKVFGAYTEEEQFFMIMREFEAQESFYANTYEHISIVKDIFPVTHYKDYAIKFDSFDVGPDKQEALELLSKNAELIETRSNYLTHTDFVPSNFRVTGEKVYMIDLSSMHFANRYEGLARLLNWCIIHNPSLETLINEYIKNSRGIDEYLCLRLMRVYKTGFLINHYSSSLSKTTDKLHKLTEVRLQLWREILKNLIHDTPLPVKLISDYKTERDKLRSNEELERQKEFNII